MCVESRADLLVTGRLGSFDLTAVAVPNGFDTDAVGHVVAAIGAGPHSTLAADVAYLIGKSLEVPTEFVTAAPTEVGSSTSGTLGRLTQDRPGTTWRTVDSADPTRLLATAPDRSLLVVGAPGGNWFQRQLFGPGAKLRAHAPAGSVVVRSAPRRVFHRSEDMKLWVAPQLQAQDALGVMTDPVVAVVEGGLLVGIARRSALTAPGVGTVGDVMEPPPTVSMTDALDTVAELGDFFEGSPIPIVNDEGRLVACVTMNASNGLVA